MIANARGLIHEERPVVRAGGDRTDAEDACSRAHAVLLRRGTRVARVFEPACPPKTRRDAMEPLRQWWVGGPSQRDRPSLELQDVAFQRTTPPTIFDINRINDGRGQSSLTFVAISDTHDEHSKITVPAADVLLHCGDYSNHKDSKGGVKRFNEWLGTLPHKHKLVIAGNHETHFIGKTKKKIQAVLTNATFMWDNDVLIDGCRIYGTPYHIKRNGLLYWAGAFGLDELDASDAFRKIPNDTDILLTHCPPSGIMDMGNHLMGSASLTAAVQRAKPTVHVFGHNHNQPGIKRNGSTTFINATSYGDSSEPRPPILFRLWYTPKAVPEPDLPPAYNMQRRMTRALNGPLR